MDDSLRSIHRDADDFQQGAVARWSDEEEPNIVVVLDLPRPACVPVRMQNVGIIDPMLTGAGEDVHIVNLVLTVRGFRVKGPAVDAEGTPHACGGTVAVAEHAGDVIPCRSRSGISGWKPEVDRTRRREKPGTHAIRVVPGFFSVHPQGLEP